MFYLYTEVKGAFIIYGPGEGVNQRGGKNFATYSLGGGGGGEGGDFFLAYFLGGAIFFQRIIFAIFFPQKLHYMYFNSCRSTTAT